MKLLTFNRTILLKNLSTWHDSPLIFLDDLCDKQEARMGVGVMGFPAQHHTAVPCLRVRHNNRAENLPFNNRRQMGRCHLTCTAKLSLPTALSAAHGKALSSGVYPESAYSTPRRSAFSEALSFRSSLGKIERKKTIDAAAVGTLQWKVKLWVQSTAVVRLIGLSVQILPSLRPDLGQRG